MRTTRRARKRLSQKRNNHTGRYVMAALMSLGGGQGILPAAALAQETTIDDNTYANDKVYGNNDGTAPTNYNGDANNNSITITESGSVQEVYGGQSTNGQNTNSNAVTIAGQVPNDESDPNNVIYGIAIGGNTNNNGNADFNHVTVESTGNVGHNVYGGMAENGSANNNTVEIDGTVSHDTYGGYSENGNAEYNTVTINGNVYSRSIAGHSTTGKAINNTAILNNGIATVITGGHSNNGTAELNQTIINGGQTTMAMGGFGESGGGTSNVKKNTLTINGGEVDMGFGGFIESGGGNGNANDNIVNVYGGTISGLLAGGYTDNGNTIGNTINLYTLNNIINCSIYGGFTLNGTSADNTVNFLGTAILPNAILEGSTIQNLNVYTKGNSVGSINDNIGNMNFYLPADTSANDTMLTVNTGTTDLSGSTINWTAQAGLNMNVGDRVFLIRDANGLLTTDTSLPGPRSYTTPSGISNDTTYTYTTAKDAQSIYITLDRKTTTGDGITLPARTQSLVAPRTAMTSLINGGSDFVATQVMDEAEAVAIDPEISVVYGRLVPFVAIGGGSLELDTGSSTDLKAFYANLGLTKEIKNRNGSLFVGPILEYGRGNYDSYLDNGVHGWGSGHYVGAGGFARQRNHDGLYYEGDLRFGRFSSDYRGDLATGLTADYDLSGSYIAGHLGLGKIYKVNPTDTVDAYIKYFYSRTSGDEVTVHSNLNNEVYNFNSVDSHRLRLGARYYHATNARSKIYAGLAYQYEFNGEAKATHDGLCTPAPSLKGSSYMAEIGWQVKPDKTNMTADVGLTGWAGQQKGIMGRLKLSWAF